MKTAFVLFLGLFLASQSSRGSGWSRTDRNAKVIDTLEAKIEVQAKRIEAKTTQDIIERRDRFHNLFLEAELELMDAYETTIYWAYKSKNQKRFLERVSMKLKGELQTKIVKSVEKLNTLKNPIDVQDLLEAEAEKLSKEHMERLRTRYEFLLRAKLDNNGNRIVASQ